MSLRIDRASVITLLKYTIGILLLFWVARSIDWAQAISSLAHISPAAFLVILIATGIGLLGRFLMWHILISPLQSSSFLDSISITLVTNFINSLLPSRVSGRSVAPFVIRRYTHLPLRKTVAITGVHTGLFAVTYGLVSIVGLLAGFRVFSSGLRIILLLSTVLYLASGLFILIAGLRIDLVGQWLEKVRHYIGWLPYIGESLATKLENAVPIAEESATTFQTLTISPRIIVVYFLGWLVGLAIMPGLRVGVLFMEFGVETLGLLLPAYLITAYSVTLLPVTPGGIGVAEASATLVFTALGIPPTVVVPIILIDRIFGVYLPALVGWYPTMKLNLTDSLPGEG